MHNQPPRVVVSRNNLLYECSPTRHAFLCGACGLAELSYDPKTGDTCPQCGARVEEVER